MTFCTNCGALIGQDTRFCGNCGAPALFEAQNTQSIDPSRNAQYPNSDQPRVSQPSGPYPVDPALNAKAETIMGIIPLRRMKALGRFDSYVGVVTNYRLIVAQLTKQMINESVTKARKDAKAQGKGYMGQISSQMREFSSGYTTRFLGMAPSLILNETPGNFEMGNGSVSEIRLRLNRASQDEDSVRSEYDLYIFYEGSKYEYRTDESNELVRLLRSVYGDRLRTS